MGNTEAREGMIDPEVMDRILNTISEQRPPSGNSNPPTFMRTGDRVVLHSLDRTDLNGRYALVLNPEMDFNRRYHVRLEDTMLEVKVRVGNMTKIRTVPDTVQTIDEEDSVDASSLVQHGDCVICLGQDAATEVIVPCGLTSQI